MRVVRGGSRAGSGRVKKASKKSRAGSGRVKIPSLVTGHGSRVDPGWLLTRSIPSSLLTGVSQNFIVQGLPKVDSLGPKYF